MYIYTQRHYFHVNSLVKNQVNSWNRCDEKLRKNICSILPKTFARLAKTGSLANAKQSLTIQEHDN